MMQSQWIVQSSLKFDILNLLNTLSGDPFYVPYHQAAYDDLSPLFTPSVIESLSVLKQVVKQEHNQLIGPFLSLYFSALDDDQTLEDLLYRLTDIEPLRSRFSQTPYYDEKNWLLFSHCLPQLQQIITWLIEIDFIAWYEENVLLRVEGRVQKLRQELEQMHIMPTVRAYLGRELRDSYITVFVLGFAAPHGIKIVGARYLTDVRYSTAVATRIAVHEMLHPPYNWQTDQDIRSIFEPLYDDELIQAAFDHHNPDYGYNSFKGYVEENVVQALDQYILTELGMAKDPVTRWQKADEGMHVLAAALFQLMCAEDFSHEDDGIRNFIMRISHKLKPGLIKNHYEALMSS